MQNSLEIEVIKHKIALMTFSCVHNMSPAHCSICRPVTFVDGHVMLRSANCGELTKRHVKRKHYCPRSFHVSDCILHASVAL